MPRCCWYRRSQEFTCGLGPGYQPIPDKELEITALLKAISDRAMLGTSREADFTAADWAEWSPWQRQSQQDGARLGKAISFVLVQREQEGHHRSYRYRARWNFATCLFHIVLDEENRVAEWTTEDVELN